MAYNKAEVRPPFYLKQMLKNPIFKIMRDQNLCARWASTVRSSGINRVFPVIPPHPTGNGRVEGSKAHFTHGMDAAARSRHRGGAAENAKGVFL